MKRPIFYKQLGFIHLLLPQQIRVILINHEGYVLRPSAYLKPWRAQFPSHTIFLLISTYEEI